MILAPVRAGARSMSKTPVDDLNFTVTVTITVRTILGSSSLDCEFSDLSSSSISNKIYLRERMCGVVVPNNEENAGNFGPLAC